MYRSSAARCVPPSIYIGFRLLALPKGRPGQLSSMPSLGDRGGTTFSQWNLDYAKHKLKCRGDLSTLSQGFVWIKIRLFDQLAELWVAYFRVVYFPAIWGPLYVYIYIYIYTSLRTQAETHSPQHCPKPRRGWGGAATSIHMINKC